MSFVNKPLTDIMDCVRASTATYVDATGKIRTAGVNEPRIDYSSGQGRLLVEEARTNLLTWSEDFTHSSWTNNSVGITVSSNVALAPDGTMSADKIIPDSVDSTHILRQYTSVTDGVTYTQSYYVKAGGYNIIRVLTSTGFSGGGECFINIATGEVISNTFSSPPTVVLLSGGWVRVSVTATASDTTLIGRFQLYPITTPDPTGDGTSGIYIWGAQLEAGSGASSYIKTEASAVTRAADNVSRVLGDEFNESEGTFYIKLNPINILSGSGYGRLISVTDGTNNNRISIQWRLSATNGKIDIRPVVSKNGTVFVGLINTIDIGEVILVVRYNNESIDIITKDVQSTLDISSVNTFTSLNLLVINGLTDAIGAVHGIVEFDNFKHYPKALSDIECEELTRI